MFTQKRAHLNETLEYDFPIHWNTWKDGPLSPFSEPDVHRLKPDFDGALYYSFQSNPQNIITCSCKHNMKTHKYRNVIFGLSLDFGLLMPPYSPMMSSNHVITVKYLK